MADVAVYIGGVDVTNVCVNGSWTRRLNRPSVAQVKIPMQEITVSVGEILRIEARVGMTMEIVFHGMIQLVEVEADEDTGYATVNATDPMELWDWRPVRDDTCDYSLPTIIDDYQSGPQILQAMLANSEDCGDSSPEDCEGPLFLDYGTFESGGCSMTGAPTDWPMTIGQLFALMVSTGCLDAVITPTNPGGGILGEINAYNGDYGTDLSSSVVFQYGTGARNIRRLRWNSDMSNMSNKIRYLAGPRCSTPSDPQAAQHWCFDVQADDPDLPDPIPNGVSLATLLADRLTSQSTYGVRMDIQIFDAVDDDCCGNQGTTFGRDLYRNRWETESWIRQQPRDLYHITPIRGIGIGEFDIGDLVGVEAAAAVNGGFSGAQRVYSYTVSWDEDSVLALSELQTSDTADA